MSRPMETGGHIRLTIAVAAADGLKRAMRFNLVRSGLALVSSESYCWFDCG